MANVEGEEERKDSSAHNNNLDGIRFAIWRLFLAATTTEIMKM